MQNGRDTFGIKGWLQVITTIVALTTLGFHVYDHLPNKTENEQGSLITSGPSFGPDNASEQNSIIYAGPTQGPGYTVSNPSTGSSGTAGNPSLSSKKIKDSKKYREATKGELDSK